MSCCDNKSKGTSSDVVEVLTPKKGLSLHHIPTTLQRPQAISSGIQTCVTPPSNGCCEVHEAYVAPGCDPVPASTCGVSQMSSCSTPFYTQVPTCPEQTTKYITQAAFATSIKNSAAFNMPDCNGVATVKFPGVVNVALYSRIWAYGVGFLTITGLDPSTSTLTLRNDCEDCAGQTQASAGTQIPACTEFVVTAPPCSSATPGGVTATYPYLAAQFTAPANGSCIDIAVTNVNGLSVNKNVQISGGTYLVDEIKSGTLITICNQGSGVTPGTVVNAQDNQGNYITPIVLIDANPCTNTGQYSGKMIVCKNNLQVPLLGSNNGQVPVLDSSTGEVNFRDLLIPVGDCTILTVCLTLDPALPPGTSYLVTVQTTAIFAPGDAIVIAGRAFTVDSIVDGTRMYITPNSDPTAIENYDVGQTVCDADCCTVISTGLAANRIVSASANTVLVTPGSTGAPGAGAVAGNIVSVVIPNTSPNKNMIVMFNTHWRFGGAMEGAADASGQLRFLPRYQIDIGPVGTTVPAAAPAALYNLDNRFLINAAGADTEIAHTDYRGDTAVVLPGTEYRVTAQAGLNLYGGTATDFDYDALEAAIDAIGIAL